MHKLELAGVNTDYGDFHSVENVTMNIPERAVTAFIGPSGTGKSTVLRTLNRMHEAIPGAHVTGEIKLDGKDIYAPDVDPVSVRNSVGMVFQKPNPFPTMSIEDNVVAGLKLAGERDKKKLREVAERSLRSANLWEEVKDRLAKPGGSLSGGQQAARVSDKTAFFSLEATGKPGRLVEFDDTATIFENPAHKETQDYVTGRFG